MLLMREEGDILYIPRGWWHSAVALGEPTFHIAAGVHTCKYLDYIEWVVKNKLKNNESVRASVVFGEGLGMPNDSMMSDMVREVTSSENWMSFINESNSSRIDASDIGIVHYAKKFDSAQS